MNLPQPITDDDKRTVRVLILEDEPMIALSIEDILVDAGFAIAGVATKLEKALALIEAALAMRPSSIPTLRVCVQILQQSRWRPAGCLSSFCPATRRNR